MKCRVDSIPATSLWDAMLLARRLKAVPSASFGIGWAARQRLQGKPQEARYRSSTSGWEERQAENVQIHRAPLTSAEEETNNQKDATATPTMKYCGS